ncbi:MAG: AmmeMemoRadiSam system protein B [Acidimicrobiales bacterium]
MNGRVRPPVVAGSFYPAEPAALRGAMSQAFEQAVAPDAGDQPLCPRALIVPHAGYVYSGPIAASAYLRLRAARDTIRRVVLLGPSHRVPFDGIAASSAEAFATPLGTIPIDIEARSAVLEVPHVTVNDAAHAHEHSLEVQLPFLQTVLDDFRLLPLVVGTASPDQVAAVIDRCGEGADTVIIVSTDLSHYHRYDEAVVRDRRTATAIASRRFDEISLHDACGANPLNGMLLAAAEQGLAIEQLDLRNSGDTSGDHERVVGYGAFAVG